MFSLLSLCDLGTFPWLLFWWLLPFLLGLLLGKFIWGAYKRRVEELESENRTLLERISGLEDELDRCRRNSRTLNNDITSLRAQIRELRGDDSDDSGATSKGLGDATKTSSNLGAVSGDATKTSSNLGAGLGAGSSISSSLSSGSGMQSHASPGLDGDAIYSALKEDNLQLIEGVGPKMESILKEHGYTNWSALAGQSGAGLRSLLDTNYGTRYRIIDPTTWPDQAALARDGKWNELIAMQKGLSGGKSNNINLTNAKVEKVLIKMGVLKRWQKDDLKAVEGIGPKIEGLLKKEGINTWERLANTEVDRIQEILDAAGDRYKLADPGTWPRQSGMAAAGKWKELEEYQDFLQGGKE